MFFGGLLQTVGRKTIEFVRQLGKMGVFLGTSVFYIFVPPFLAERIFKQTHFLGVKTIPVIILTGAFTGMVLTLQSYYVLVRFGAESATGSITALSLIREIGPVLAALMVVGRAGSALTAEIGIMRMSEQIDALDAMGLNPYKYLVVPNFLAALISLPVLTAMFILSGVWGGYLVVIKLTGLSSGVYFGAMSDSIMFTDLAMSLYKSIGFGFLIAGVCCFKGFFVGTDSGFGAQGVSKATTSAVVLTSVLVLVLDYFITSVMIFN